MSDKKNFIESLLEDFNESREKELIIQWINHQLAEDLVNKYPHIYEFNDWFAEVKNANNLLWIIDTNWNEIIHPMYDYIKRIDNVFLVEKWGMYWIINLEWNIILEPKYTYISEFQNWFAMIMCDNKFWFINNKFQEICTPKYFYAENFENWIAIVWKKATRTDWSDYKAWNILYWFINEEWTEIAKPMYDDIWNFENWVAPAIRNWKKWNLHLDWFFELNKKDWE